jgi:hypothetical protein
MFRGPVPYTDGLIAAWMPRGLSQVLVTTADDPGLAWMYLARCSTQRTFRDTYRIPVSTSQAEYAGSIPVIGSTSSRADTAQRQFAFRPVPLRVSDL